MSDVVGLQREGGLAVLTLDNPPLNLFSADLIDGLVLRMAELTRDPPRALLIRGAGDLTSGGVDVAQFAAGDAAQFAAASRRVLEQVIDPLEALPCPTIAECHGLCLTAAFELALACDLILAARSTQFGLVEASLGLTPAMGGTQRLAAKVGVARATELVVLSKLYPAETLREWGAINRVYDDDGLHGAARTLAARLADGPTLAHRATKAVLRELRAGGVAAADRRTPELAGALFETDDLRAGVRSFLEHGPGQARFAGR